MHVYCVCTNEYMWMRVHECINTCESQRLTLVVFLCHSPHYFLRSGPSLNLGLVDLERLACEQASDNLLSPSPSAGVTRAPCHVDVRGLHSGLHACMATLYWLSQLVGTQINVLNRDVNVTKEQVQEDHGVALCSKRGHGCCGNSISLSDLVFESSLFSTHLKFQEQ